MAFGRPLNRKPQRVAQFRCVQCGVIRYPVRRHDPVTRKVVKVVDPCERHPHHAIMPWSAQLQSAAIYIEQSLSRQSPEEVRANIELQRWSQRKLVVLAVLPLMLLWGGGLPERSLGTFRAATGDNQSLFSERKA